MSRLDDTVREQMDENDEALAPSQSSQPSQSTQPRNPWMIVLWSLAPVLVVLGLIALWLALTIHSGTTDQVTDTIYPVIALALWPWLFGAGLAALAAAIAIRVVIWRRG